MTAPELKPCPFCGGEAITSPSVVDRQVLYAHCKDHTCPGWTVSRCPPVRWNSRADLTAVQPAQVRVKPEAAEILAKEMQAIVAADRWKGRDLSATPPEKWSHLRAETRQFWIDTAARILAALEPQPDPRDEVIKGLAEAATGAAEAIDMAYGSDDDESPHRHSAKLRTALAAAKAVQHG